MCTCMLKVNNLIGLEEHLDNLPQPWNITYTHTRLCFSPLSVHRQTPLNGFLGQHWKQGIMGVICYLFWRLHCCLLVTFNLTDHDQFSRWTNQSPHDMAQKSKSPTRGHSGTWISGKVTAPTFRWVNYHRIKSDRIISHRNPPRHRIQN